MDDGSCAGVGICWSDDWYSLVLSLLSRSHFRNALLAFWDWYNESRPLFTWGLSYSVLSTAVLWTKQALA